MNVCCAYALLVILGLGLLAVTALTIATSWQAAKLCFAIKRRDSQKNAYDL